MKEGFVVNDRLVGRVITTTAGDKVDMIFPHQTEFKFDGKTIIADLSKKTRDYKYIVLAYDEGRITRTFYCNDINVLDNGNYKLRLRKDYEGVERCLLYNPKTGKQVSDIYDDMSDLGGDGTFLCTINVNKRRYFFDYLLKIDKEGKIVTDVYNTYTEEIIDYKDIPFDENETIKLITKKSDKNFVKGFELPIKIM